MTSGGVRIENQVEFAEALDAVVLAERIVSYLHGGGPAVAISTSNREELDRAGPQKPLAAPANNWFLSRGKTTFAVEISNLFHCETVLGRNRSLFEVARVVKEGAVRGVLPVGEWVLGGAIDQTSDVVRVATELGEVSVAIETIGDDFRALSDDRSNRYDKQVSLPVSILPREWGSVLAGIKGPMSLIAKGPLVVKVLEELFYIEYNAIEEGLTMLLADQFMESTQDEQGVEPESEADPDREATLPISLHLGDLQLQLSQLAKLRKGHMLRLMDETSAVHEGVSCTLQVGSTHIGRGRIRFLGERMVLTISEML